jgi:hypothetical protein
VTATAERLQQRRFLLMTDFAGKRVEAVWVDDDDSCQKAGRHTAGEAGEGSWGTRWHHYTSAPEAGPRSKDNPPRVWSIRCPGSLSDGEWKRLHTDNPPGEYRAIVADAQENLESEAKKRKRAAREKREATEWSD